jgi:hypothetical protein
MNTLTTNNHNQSASEAMFLALTAGLKQINQINQIIEIQLGSQNDSGLFNPEPTTLDSDELGQRVYDEIRRACYNQNSAISNMFQAFADSCDWHYIGRRLAAWHKVREPWHYEQ